MEDYSKLVIELYREQFLAYTGGLPVNVDSIFSVQDCLLKAIDKAKVNNEPTDYLVNLKNEVEKHENLYLDHIRFYFSLP